MVAAMVEKFIGRVTVVADYYRWFIIRSLHVPRSNVEWVSLLIERDDMEEHNVQNRLLPTKRIDKVSTTDVVDMELAWEF